MISRYFKFDTHRILHNLRKSTTSHCFRGCLRMDEVVRNEKNEIIRKIVKIRKARCSPQGAPCTYYKPPSFGIPGREPPMPQLKVSNQVPNKEIFLYFSNGTATCTGNFTSTRICHRKKQGAFCKSLRKSSKSGFNFLGFSRLNHGGAEAEQPQTSHCWWMVMNHYERNDSRDFGITGICSGRKRMDEYETQKKCKPSGRRLAGNSSWRKGFGRWPWQELSWVNWPL